MNYDERHAGGGRGARVIVTGALGGVGRAAVRALEARGARVVGLDQYAKGAILAADVRDPASVRAAVRAAIDRLGGGLDALVNNAGIAGPTDAGADPDERARAMLEVNLFGTWRVTAAAMPALVQSRGRVVNVASGLSFANLPLAAAYCASKRALAAYSDCLRLEYGRDITVTTIYPMYMRTALHAPGESAGLFLDGILREESVDDAARAVVRAIFGRPAREVATTPLARAELTIARIFPAIADRVIARRMRRAAERGRFSAAPVATPLVARIVGKT